MSKKSAATPQKTKYSPKTIVALVVLMAAVLFAWYATDAARPDDTATAAMESTETVEVRELSEKAYAFVPVDEANIKTALVFYPGAKVQAPAYAPLMQQCADQGILCILVRPLFNMAVMDVNAPDGVMEQFPNVETWYIGGHSLGGTAAGKYLAEHDDDFEGIVLLASYVDADLSASDNVALSVIGTEDGVLDRTKYAAALPLLPANAQEVTIEGGNHAQYGNYGTQANDGTATISAEEQQAQTVAAITSLIN